MFCCYNLQLVVIVVISSYLVDDMNSSLQYWKFVRFQIIFNYKTYFVLLSQEEM